MQSCKSACGLVKIKNRSQVVNRVISATQLELEELERFHFLLTPLMSAVCDLVKTRLSKSETEAEAEG